MGIREGSITIVLQGILSIHLWLHAQTWDVWVPTQHDVNSPATEDWYQPLCREWLKQLLLSTPGLEALYLGPVVLRPCMLGELPVRHLKLVLEKDREQPWLAGFLSDMRRNTTLESLTILSRDRCRPLPKLQLASMQNLKHVKLQAWLPIGTLTLPKHCLLHLDVHLKGVCRWEEFSQEVYKHASVLHLCVGRLDTWPAGIEHFSNLQCLALHVDVWVAGSVPEYPNNSTEPLDLTDLRHIPHVRLINCGAAKRLKVTAGSWQSLDIRGFKSIAFTDIDAFLQGTSNFTFEFKVAGSSSLSKEADAALAAVREGCEQNGVLYNICSTTAISTAEKTLQALYTYTKHGEGLCNCNNLHDFGYCNMKGGAYLWKEDTFWPRDPCSALIL